MAEICPRCGNCNVEINKNYFWYCFNCKWIWPIKLQHPSVDCVLPPKTEDCVIGDD